MKALKKEILKLQEIYLKRIEERNMEIARNLLKKNMNIQDISEVTGLLVGEIEKLK